MSLLAAALAVGACAAASSTPGGIQNGNPGAVSSESPSGAAAPHASGGAASLRPGRVPPALRGTYSASVTGTTASSGVWTLEVTAMDLFLTNPRGGDPFSVDVITISDTQVRVYPARDCEDQTTVTDGLYTMSLTGDQLAFVADHDSCGDRKAVLSTTPWTRKR